MTESKAKKTLKKAEPEKKKSAEKKTAKPKNKVALKSKKNQGPDKKKQQGGKKYRALLDLFDRKAAYKVSEAIDLAKKTSPTKFDSSVELHINLNVDPKNPNHHLRGSVLLPAGSGKVKKIAVICGEAQEKAAKDSGADRVGGKDLIEKIQKGDLDFDVLVSTPEMMPELAKVAKILGPKGLMPNPKDKTVSDDIKTTISEIKKGRVEYRTDSYGIVHVVIGRVSFEKSSLVENMETMLREIHTARPQGIKTNFIKSIYLTTTMGPSIKVEE